MIGKPGLPTRVVAGPGATLSAAALDLLRALGNAENAKETVAILEQLRDGRLAFEAATAEATAKIAEASKVIDDADNAEQAARETLRNVEAECARLRGVVASAQADLDTDRAQHDEGVRVDTATLVAREAAVAEREAASRALDEQQAVRLSQLSEYSERLSIRETAVSEREAAMDAREARLKAALG